MTDGERRFQFLFGSPNTEQKSRTIKPSLLHRILEIALEMEGAARITDPWVDHNKEELYIKTRVAPYPG